MSPLAVVLWSQLAGTALLLTVTLLSRTTPVWSGMGWGVLAGVVGAVGLICFYSGLAAGAMSIVAPISGCGGVVPVLIAIVSGHPPDPVALTGMALACIGIVIVSVHPETDAHPSGRPMLAIGLALGSALGFGLFYVFLHRSGAGGFSALWAVLAARAGSVTFLTLIGLAGRRDIGWPGSRMLVIGMVGVFDMTANVLWLAATVHANLGVAGILGSLYPVTTVLLGWIVLSERLTWLQRGGVVCALAGVALVGQ